MTHGTTHAGVCCRCGCVSAKADVSLKRRSRHSPRWVAHSGSQPSLSIELLASSHPDAVRRRHEAEQRRAMLRQEVASVSHVNWWEGELPANLLSAGTPEAFRQAVASHRLLPTTPRSPFCQ
ncbi:hypothetical protein WJX81_007273 [Elliptochloris bilobata]|uniref:Uncharacterized protein n=1 Tax=Elliptochloris bilobata TaxID=381761 RepID=A0AAW1RWR1_9CHLO